MPKGHKLTEEELNSLLKEQIEALNSSCEGYDKGNQWEAKRLATSIYLLCHDPMTSGRKSRTQSLLKQTNHKSGMKFLSTSRHIPKTLIPWLPLIHMHANETTPFSFQPFLESDERHWDWVSFTSWWEELIFETDKGFKISRKSLIFSMRNQDGGGHVDEFITDENYATLRKLNDRRIRRKKFIPGEKPLIRIKSDGSALSDDDDDFEPIPGAHLANMRQIAFELMKSLEQLEGVY